MTKRTAILLWLISCCACSGAAGSAIADTIPQIGHRPLVVLGRQHPGKITGEVEEGVVVDLRGGGTQVVQFSEIWRIRRAFASDEPPGTSVIDFANNRLFVATPVANLAGDIGKKIALGQFTAPNGEIIYIATGHITGISNALPGLHNPASKAVIATRDGTQQVTETTDAAKRIVAGAQIAP